MITGVRVIIGTYGDCSWAERASEAVQSAVVQGCDVVHVHGATLADARNLGAQAPGAEWLVFLDADDTLGPTYVRDMLDAPDTDLRQPATLGVYPDGHTDLWPCVIPARDSIRSGNWFVLGTMLRREMFLDAGGFGPEPAWEDWSLMLRCFALGATWGPVPDAVYRVGVRETSRNTAVADQTNLLNSIVANNDRWAAERGLVIA